MEKGILHIRRKPRHILFNGRQIAIKKEVPEIGKEYDKLECEFEGDPALKIIVDGVVFSADMIALEGKKQKAKEVAEFKTAYDKMLEDQEKSGDSYSLTRARIPQDTKNQLLEDGDNFSLKLNKFARYDFKDNKEEDKHFKFFNAKDIKTGKPDVRTIVPAISIKANFGNLFKTQENQLADRIKTSAQAVFPDEGQLLSPIFRPEWRFVTGLGGHSVYETGITLHHVYGIPYIPASSIKGVVRGWIIQSHPDFKNNEGLAIANKDFCDVFGCPTELTVEKDSKKKNYKSVYNEAREGKITFFDALPIDKPTIQPDIMNPHYPDYYTGTEAPTDTQSPTPIFFLTVAKTRFQFLLGTKAYNLTTQLFWGKTLGDWLKDALEEHGIGAKTAVGYGYMTPL